MRERMPVFHLAALPDAHFGEDGRMGIVLPPFVEPSMLVEHWRACDFLAQRFDHPARIGSVSTFVDVRSVAEHLASSAPLSLHGWGRSPLDKRSVADIAVEQIESATHLVLVGPSLAAGLARRLAVLNPTAERIDPRDAAALGGLERDDGDPLPVVPPWLSVLRGEREPAPGTDLFVYRRSRPFDAGRFGEWIATPPRGLVRGKGNVWLDSDSDQSFGYSCAGSVHRLFPSGRWWASRSDGAWPECDAHRRRLLARWHPRFGDRRQEIVFTGAELERERLAAELDACLVRMDANEAAWSTWVPGDGATSITH
ncbi:MAG: GTP-binding protein [Myxococcota bacterium]|nr:GTP-binding protein [Myxococcota bacterium]